MELLSTDNRDKSRKQSRPDKRFSVYRIGNRNSHAKAYDAESIHSDISEPAVVIEGLKIKYVLFFYILVIILLLFARKYSFWNLCCAFTLFLCVAMVGGILIVYFTSQKLPGMFLAFFHSLFLSLIILRHDLY